MLHLPSFIGLPHSPPCSLLTLYLCLLHDQDEPLAVVGGGDSAVEEAVYLTKYSPRVHLLVRGSEVRGRLAEFRPTFSAEPSREALRDRPHAKPA